MEPADKIALVDNITPVMAGAAVSDALATFFQITVRDYAHFALARETGGTQGALEFPAGTPI